MIIALRTDRPQAEVGLYEISGRQMAHRQWQAHRELSATLHKTIIDLLEEAGFTWSDIRGIVFYKGPGSFTGLRIGAAVANAIASHNNVAVSNQSGEAWIDSGLNELSKGLGGPALPDYGEAPRTTTPRK